MVSSGVSAGDESLNQEKYHHIHNSSNNLGKFRNLQDPSAVMQFNDSMSGIRLLNNQEVA